MKYLFGVITVILTAITLSLAYNGLIGRIGWIICLISIITTFTFTLMYMEKSAEQKYKSSQDFEEKRKDRILRLRNGWTNESNE